MEAVTKERMRELGRIKQRLQLGGGGDRLEKQHKSGKLSARERLALLLDRKSFREAGLFAKHNGRLFGMDGKELPADGVVTGRGRIDGRLVHVASQDFTVAGGSAGEVHANKIADTMKSALKTGSPFIFINDSGGARVQEGVGSLAGYARIFYQNVVLSGVVPQISLICGPCAGGAAYSPALTDFIIQTHDAQMFITGPAVIKQVTGEIVAPEELGGPRAQMNKSGVVHFVAENDVEAVKICQRLLSFLPNNNLEEPPRLDPGGAPRDDDELNDIVPADPKSGYDVKKIVTRVVDRGDFLEVQAEFAKNLVVGFAPSSAAPACGTAGNRSTTTPRAPTSRSARAPAACTRRRTEWGRLPACAGLSAPLVILPHSFMDRLPFLLLRLCGLHVCLARVPRDFGAQLSIALPAGSIQFARIYGAPHCAA